MMIQRTTSTLMLATLAMTSAFTIPVHNRNVVTMRSSLYSSVTVQHDGPENNQMEEPAAVQQPLEASTTTAVTSKAPMEKKKAGPQHTEGVFSPVVYLAKNALGEAELRELRAKIISMHSDVIKQFVDTSSSPLGQSVLKVLFEVADQDKNGTVDADELKAAMELLRFDWLQEKQIKKIVERADANGDGVIDLEEWMTEAPKTLKTNLVKLAKKNGNDMGLLV